MISILSGLVGALTVYLLSLSIRGVVVLRAGQQPVTYSSAYRLLVLSLFPLSGFVTSAAASLSTGQRLAALLITVMFWVGTLYLTYTFFFVRLSYDDDFIYHWTPLRGHRHIPWSEVESIHYFAFGQVYVIGTSTYGRISISPVADGWIPFLQRICDQIDCK